MLPQAVSALHPAADRTTVLTASREDRGRGAHLHMRYLITGGAGFIGSHLSEELLRRGHSVHVLDDLSTGGMEYVRHLKEVPEFDYTIESASNGQVVAELVDWSDAVYHLAAAVGVELIVES